MFLRATETGGGREVLLLESPQTEWPHQELHFGHPGFRTVSEHTLVLYDAVCGTLEETSGNTVTS